MYPPVQTVPLIARLESRPELLAKILELRGRVGLFLRGVDATFLHFTSHAVDHSDQIVRELSNMLFLDPNDQKSMTVDLNETETYFLLVSIYLHDVGMVVTDQEKYRVLSSESWRDFAAAEVQTAIDIQKIRRDFELVGPTDLEPQELFVAALEQRLLLAKFFRSQHAARAGGAINGALRIEDDFLGGDHAAAGTITAICVGHGLNRSELASDVSYPTRRDHFGEPVNVRLLAVLLRIGDLLDMRSARACPLMHSVVSPLPTSSEVHWDQYHRIVSRVTSPTSIELRAECETAEEHRTLLDWCKWLEDELREAPRLLGRGRLTDWIPPRATASGADATIQIGRAPGAKYRAEDWRFRLDESEVVTRLVRDVHRHPFGFLRELLQNALDTCRARLYLENGITEPYVNLVPEVLRERYPVSVVLFVGDRGVEAIEVADSGLGMTPEIVRDYFLQIGRSWYRSAEFTSGYAFNPTSRFGIGFLSVFAVSQDVLVTTRWHNDTANSAIIMQLQGPRNYLLIEDGARESPGTTVKVNLESPVSLDDAMSFLAFTCVANEFPIVVIQQSDGVNTASTNLPMRPVRDHFLPLEAGPITVQLHRVDSKTEGVFGFFEFMMVERTGRAEDWSRGLDWIRDHVLEADPLSRIPNFPPSWLALNGLSSAQVRSHDGRRFERDVRIADAAGNRGLDRESPDDRINFPELGEALDEHLATRSHSLKYLHRLFSRFQQYAPHWADRLEHLSTLDGPRVSVEMLHAMDTVYIAIDVADRRVSEKKVKESLVGFETGGAPLIMPNWYEDECLPLVELRSKGITRVHDVSPGVIVLELRENEGAGYRGPVIDSVDFGEATSIVTIYPDYHPVVNASHPFIEAVNRIGDQHSDTRERIRDSLVAYSLEDLGDVLGAVGGALKDPVLIAYHRYIAGQKSFVINPRTRQLRLPLKV